MLEQLSRCRRAEEFAPLRRRDITSEAPKREYYSLFLGIQGAKLLLSQSSGGLVGTSFSCCRDL